jgi:hypothetical protein
MHRFTGFLRSKKGVPIKNAEGTIRWTVTTPTDENMAVVRTNEKGFFSYIMGQDNNLLKELFKFGIVRAIFHGNKTYGSALAFESVTTTLMNNGSYVVGFQQDTFSNYISCRGFILIASKLIFKDDNHSFSSDEAKSMEPVAFLPLKLYFPDNSNAMITTDTTEADGSTHVKDQTLACYAVYNGMEKEVFDSFLPNCDHYYPNFDRVYPDGADHLHFKYSATTQSAATNKWSNENKDEFVDLSKFNTNCNFNLRYSCLFDNLGDLDDFGIHITW